MCSLGGQNSLGRKSGPRSSRGASKLFKKLQKIDKKIAPYKEKIDRYRKYGVDYFGYHEAMFVYQKLDEKRRLIRIERKYHGRRNRETE